MEGIIGLLIVIADVYAIVKIAQSSAEPVNKIIWVVLVLVFPFIGLVAWYYAGPGGKNG